MYACVRDTHGCVDTCEGLRRKSGILFYHSLPYSFEESLTETETHSRTEMNLLNAQQNHIMQEINKSGKTKSNLLFAFVFYLYSFMISSKLDI